MCQLFNILFCPNWPPSPQGLNVLDETGAPEQNPPPNPKSLGNFLTCPSWIQTKAAVRDSELSVALCLRLLSYWGMPLQ